MIYSLFFLKLLIFSISFLGFGFSRPSTASKTKCTFGWCGKEEPLEADPIFDSEVQSIDIRPGKDWIVAVDHELWHSRSGKWEEIQECPQFFMVGEYSIGFVGEDSSVRKFSMTCGQFPKSETDDKHVEILKSKIPCAISLLVTIPYSRKTEEKILSVGDTSFMSRSNNIQIVPYANGFEMPSTKNKSLHLLKLTYSENENFNTRENSGSSYCPERETGKGNQCPTTFRICGVKSMQTLNSNGIVALAFKCCPFCRPQEKWMIVHNVINPSSETYKDFDPMKIYQTTFHSNNNDEVDALNLSILERFSSVIGSSEETKFNWSKFKSDISNNSRNNNNNSSVQFRSHYKKYPVWMAQLKENERKNRFSCPSWRKCVYKRLVGICGDCEIKTEHFIRDIEPMTFRDYFHCLVLSSEPVYYKNNTCVHVHYGLLNYLI